MIIKYEDIDRIINILQETKNNLKPGEFYKFEGNKKKIINIPSFDTRKGWYITTTKKTNTIICDWFDSLGHNSDRTIGNHYGYNSKGKPDGRMNYVDKKILESSDYFGSNSEITFEEFKTYILNED